MKKIQKSSIEMQEIEPPSHPIIENIITRTTIINQITIRLYILTLNKAITYDSNTKALVKLQQQIIVIPNWEARSFK